MGENEGIDKIAIRWILTAINEWNHLIGTGIQYEKSPFNNQTYISYIEMILLTFVEYIELISMHLHWWKKIQV